MRDLVAQYDRVKAVDGISFDVGQGEHLTLLGPSGCGKTTTLRVLAGLETALSGEIRIGGDIVYSSHRGVNVPTERRGLAMVFQSYAIWPHMTVAENVAYGLKLRGIAGEARRLSVQRALDVVGMAAFAGRSASDLSGGQQQRVALARALIIEPRVLLLDEPLSNLDARLRAKMRNELQALQQRTGVTSVYVTHDQEEALAFSDRILVMHQGRIAQAGSPVEIYERPRTEFVADFVGAANLLHGPAVTAGDGRIEVALSGLGNVTALTLGRSHGAEAHLAIRPAHIALSRERPTQGNTFRATIRQRAFLGDTVEYVVDASGLSLLVRRPAHESFGIAENVFTSFPAESCILLEPD